MQRRIVQPNKLQDRHPTHSPKTKLFIISYIASFL